MPSLPIPLDTLRTRLRIEVESDDSDLATLCIAAGEIIERETGVALASASRTAKITPWRAWTPRVQPCTSIESVHYIDDAGDTVELPIAQWFTLSADEMLTLHFDTQIVPAKNTEATVTYTAGYTVIPHALQQCIVALVGAWYANPEAASVASLIDVPLAYKYILAQYATRGPLR